jgi:hypothetical protein
MIHDFAKASKTLIQQTKSHEGTRDYNPYSALKTQTLSTKTNDQQ